MLLEGPSGVQCGSEGQVAQGLAGDVIRPGGEVKGYCLYPESIGVPFMRM